MMLAMYMGVAIALSATSLGVIVPVLKDAGQAERPLGQLTISASSIADFSAVLLLTLFFSMGAGSLVTQLVVIAGFAAVATAAAIGLRRLGRWTALEGLVVRLQDTTAEIRVRFAETDAQGVAHNASYLVWFEVARGELSIEARTFNDLLELLGTDATADLPLSIAGILRRDGDLWSLAAAKGQVKQSDFSGALALNEGGPRDPGRIEDRTIDGSLNAPDRSRSDRLTFHLRFADTPPRRWTLHGIRWNKTRALTTRVSTPPNYLDPAVLSRLSGLELAQFEEILIARPPRVAMRSVARAVEAIGAALADRSDL